MNSPNVTSIEYTTDNRSICIVVIHVIVVVAVVVVVVVVMSLWWWWTLVRGVRGFYRIW